MALLIAPEVKAGYGSSYNPDTINPAPSSGTCFIQGSVDGNNDDWLYRTFLQHDFSGIPADAEILSAKLHLFCLDRGENAANGTTNVARVTQEWDESTLSWNTMPTSEGTYLPYDVSPPSVDAWGVWDITSLVKGWVSGEIPNQGLQIVNNNEGSYRYQWKIATRYYEDAALATFISVETDDKWAVRGSRLTDIANHVRRLTGTVTPMTLEQITTALSEMTGASDQTAETGSAYLIPSPMSNGERHYYNEYLLPGIPAEMLERYPYAWMNRNTETGVYNLIISTRPWHRNSSGSLESLYGDISLRYTLEIANEADAQWLFVAWIQHGGMFSIADTRPTVWANYDIYNGTVVDGEVVYGEIYFRGSAAVPAEEVL